MTAAPTGTSRTASTATVGAAAATSIEIPTASAAAITTVAVRRPATAGPHRRAALNSALLRATALGTSSDPTMPMTDDWRVGLSTTVTHPSRNTSAYTIQSSTTPVATTRNSAN